MKVIQVVHFILICPVHFKVLQTVHLVRCYQREPCLLQIFKKEDIEFFEYVFTAKGCNIRNNVAHAFYLPVDYGTTEATLVFLCILRLTMFKPKGEEKICE